jgi:hypothetical protein
VAERPLELKRDSCGTVPASAAGITFQFHRALRHLAGAVDGHVGVEAGAEATRANIRRRQKHG